MVRFRHRKRWKVPGFGRPNLLNVTALRLVAKLPVEHPVTLGWCKAHPGGHSFIGNMDIEPCPGEGVGELEAVGEKAELGSFWSAIEIIPHDGKSEGGGVYPQLMRSSGTGPSSYDCSLKLSIGIDVASRYQREVCFSELRAWSSLWDCASEDGV